MAIAASHGFRIQDLDNPNLLMHYMDKESLDRLETYQRSHPELESQFGSLDSVFFKLWTKESSGSEPFIIHQDTTAEELFNSGFKVKSETKIVVHGFSSNANTFEHLAEGDKIILARVVACVNFIL